MLELGILKSINHKNSVKILEDTIESHLEKFERVYAKDVGNSPENQKNFELIDKSIRKCLIMDPKKRPDFMQLLGDNMRNSMEKGKIKFFTAVKEKRPEELEKIDWKETKKQELPMNSEEIPQLKKNLAERNEEIKNLKKENKILLIENELLREENKKLLSGKPLEKNQIFENSRYFFRFQKKKKN